MPCDLLDAISHARAISQWHEALPPDDMPPRWMWGLVDELEDHFERLRGRRNGGSDDFDDDEPMGPVVRNDLARNRGRNAR